MNKEEHLSGVSEWNEFAQELTLTHTETLPKDLSEIKIDLQDANLVIENCIEGEEPSYKITIKAKDKTEDGARKKCGAIKDAFEIEASDGKFAVEEKPDKTNTIVQTRSTTTSTFNFSNNVIKNSVFSGSSSETGISRKIVLRIRPEQAKNLNVHTEDGNISVGKVDGEIVLETEDGNITIDKLSGKAKIRTEDGNINIRDVDGNLELWTDDGNITLNEVGGNVSIRTEDGNVTIINIAGGLNIKSEDGNISVKNAKLDASSSIKSDGNVLVQRI